MGGPGLVLLGFADNSLIPMPGSMDVLTIWLVVHHPRTWYYYAAMATAGALAGGYLTYALARRGGKGTLKHRMGQRRANQIYEGFERWGFGAVAIPALLPPPFPIVPFLVAAGALQYSRRRFLGALALGRGLRYTILGLLGIHYGRHFLRFFNRNTKPTIYVLLSMSAVGAVAALIAYLRYRHQEPELGEAHAPVMQPGTR
jgi:membrane protein YqaA with SNARE-associated domain